MILQRDTRCRRVRSSAASDGYKRQMLYQDKRGGVELPRCAARRGISEAIEIQELNKNEKQAVYSMLQRGEALHEEYESFGWFVPETLIAPGADLKLHPVLHRGVTELVRKKTKDKLQVAVLETKSDAEVAALVRQLYGKTD